MYYIIMDSKPRSTIPVTVKVASEQEPIECSGSYTEQSDGFTLEFCMNADRFGVTHSRASTTVKATGIMSYDIVLNDGVTFALLKTPYGVMKFEVKTLRREVVKLNDTLRIALEYVMTNAAVGEMRRAVDVTVISDKNTNGNSEERK